ncbi:hypothetical protein BD779DRAFT_1649717 [Infundibulicybe gibba]|nr:hypothetical protein BD779DRAFT_1649717 [Infundibulicybe gibba]
MPGTPLPRPNPHLAGARHEAYERCLGLECNLIRTPGMQEANGSIGPVLAARVLGYLLQEIPAETGKDYLANEVNNCTTGEEMELLAQFYINAFILTFKRNLGAEVIPERSEHLSRPPRDDQMQSYHDTLKRDKLDYWTSKKHALTRDCHRCHFTGRYDAELLRDNELLDQYTSGRKIKVAYLEMAYIIPEPVRTSKSIREEASDAEHGWTPAVWAVLSRFSNRPDLPGNLNGQKIHRLENVVIMEPVAHCALNALRIWLEPTPVQNEYTPRSVHDGAWVHDMLNPVIFSSTDPELPVPSPDYIALHAACAKVANLSGAGQYVESMWEDIEAARVLSTDGSSSMLLSFALNRVAERAGVP